MNVEQFNGIKLMIRSYMESLNLDECKAEIIAKGLLTTNSKLKKGENLNYGLELLPSILAKGVNMCPNAGACKFTCLAFSGQGNVLKGRKMFAGEDLSAPLKAKARRTFVYLNAKEWFDAFLLMEIRQKNEMALMLDANAYFRLNVTSDVEWIHLTILVPHIKFYDYTKVWNRYSTGNYHLTFSADEKTTDEMIEAKLSKGENVAVVFNSPTLPEKYLNFSVIDGDLNDDRTTDAKGIVVGLKLKVTVGGKDNSHGFAK
jgi:hypothetical protein